MRFLHLSVLLACAIQSTSPKMVWVWLVAIFLSLCASFLLSHCWKNEISFSRNCPPYEQNTFRRHILRQWKQKTDEGKRIDLCCLMESVVFDVKWKKSTCHTWMMMFEKRLKEQQGTDKERMGGKTTETIGKIEKCGRQWRENPLLALMSTVQIQQTTAKNKIKKENKKKERQQDLCDTYYSLSSSRLHLSFLSKIKKSTLTSIAHKKSQICGIMEGWRERERRGRGGKKKSSDFVRAAKSIARIENIEHCKHLGRMYLNRYFDIRKP